MAITYIIIGAILYHVNDDISILAMFLIVAYLSEINAKLIK